MSCYVLMNDFNSSVMPSYLHAVIDVRKQVSASWQWSGSSFSFPYYIQDPECPEQLYLLCEKNIGALRFDYYNSGLGHIASDKLMDVIGGFSVAKHISKKLLATSIGNGEIIRSDLQYTYFLDTESFIDLDKSFLEKDRFGQSIPHEIVLSDTAKKYDVFATRGTLLSGFIFVSDVVVEALSKEKIKGIKFIPMDQALKHYCIDYNYSIERSRIRKKPRLP